MNIHDIKKILIENLHPSKIEILDDSNQHKNHYDNYNSDYASHIRVTIISKKFDDITLINRHKIVNKILKESFNKNLHAASFKLISQKEFDIKN